MEETKAKTIESEDSDTHRAEIDRVSEVRLRVVFFVSLFFCFRADEPETQLDFDCLDEDDKDTDEPEPLIPFLKQRHIQSHACARAHTLERTSAAPVVQRSADT